MTDAPGAPSALLDGPDVAASADAAPRAHVPDGTPRALLTQAVRVATGLDDAEPREGQAALHDAIAKAMVNIGHHAGQAPTGSGKSLASLSPAYMAAIERQERTVISTDSLALMAQLQDKDVPTMQDAAEVLYGPHGRLDVAFLRGVSNYADPARVIATAQRLAASTSSSFRQLASELDTDAPLAGMSDFPRIDPADAETLRQIVLWALKEYIENDPMSPGDRHSCPIEHTPEIWATVSASAAEASDGDRYGVMAKAVLAKDRARDADIVVTNHSILAVQAANDVPVIIGSARLGDFHHVIVDEAHTLPGHVRSQGAKTLSGGTITRLGRQISKAAGNSTSALAWQEVGRSIADELDDSLRSFAASTRDGVKRMTDGDDPVGDLKDTIKTWAREGAKLLARKSNASGVESEIAIARARDSLDTLGATIAGVTRHRAGWARWVEQSHSNDPVKFRPWWEANVSPIDVGFLLSDNLWNRTGVDEETGETFRMSVSVCAISATMPSNYPHQAGMDTDALSKYPSPFVEAYAESALYIPALPNGHPELGAVTKPGWNGRVKFDVKAHADWAAEKIAELVDANGGSALVLSATSSNGRMYAERLRRALKGIRVYSQWDGVAATRLVRDWREEETSVLVGTKSFMTGVDAAGVTNSLVIIDRIPRSPSNPIDDARVEQIMERLGGDKWGADRYVYATDATLLLKQAAGRLIRSTSDRGMVACLDPRLLKIQPLAYAEPTRNTYMEALRDFGRKLSDIDVALDWLRQRDGGAKA